MKKTLLSLSILFTLAANAQLTQANHGPAVGNSFGTFQCDSVAPGASGTGAIWNYATLNIHTVGTLKNYVSVASTNTLYPSATIAVGSATNDTYYYSSTSANLKYYGGNMNANGVAATLNYSSPAIFATYPMSMGTSTTSATAGTVNVTSPFPTSFNFTGNCSVMVDGTGTLILPAKTFTNVMRVMTSQTITATINVNSVNYEYYAVGISRNPILTIATSTINSMAGTSTQSIVTVLSNYAVVGINEVEKSDIELSVFPNPATTLINFTTSSLEANKVIAYDVTGKIVATELMEIGKAKMNTSNLTSGVYIYHVVGKNNQVLTTGKFNVTK